MPGLCGVSRFVADGVQVQQPVAYVESVQGLHLLCTACTGMGHHVLVLGADPACRIPFITVPFVSYHALRTVPTLCASPLWCSLRGYRALPCCSLCTLPSHTIPCVWHPLLTTKLCTSIYIYIVSSSRCSLTVPSARHPLDSTDALPYDTMFRYMSS